MRKQRSGDARAFRNSAMLGLLTIAGLLFGGTHQQARAGDDATERGRYLVRQVSMCIDCHGATLGGGHVGRGPMAPVAPAIAGLPGLDVAAVAHFLETGDLNGAAVPPPMPSYRMHPDDARAVATYLKSLPPAPATASSAAPAPSPT